MVADKISNVSSDDIPKDGVKRSRVVEIEGAKKKPVACGVFGRNDVIKHVHTPMINWHGPTGTVFTVDIQPHRENIQISRVATGGADSKVQMWEVKDNEDGQGAVDHLSELVRHDSAVNCVRFHPTEDILATASDDRCLFIWKLDSIVSDAPQIFNDEGDDDKPACRENWNAVKQLRGHGSEVYDIAWSPDARYIASASMDSAAYVWDTHNNRKMAMWQHHTGYVQGIAWDPNNHYIVTVGSDRAVIVYNTKKFDLAHRISKLKVSSDASTAPSAETTASTTPTPAQTSDRSIRMFLDTGMVDTFFRRPSFSPDGKLLVLPCGCYEMENPDQEVSTTCQTPAANSGSNEDKMIQINVVYVFQHLNLEQPVMCLPTGTSPAIAIRFCPRLFNLRSANQNNLLDLPYRMVFAVITLDNVLLYDTQQPIPFASINSIHYEQLTDASWSSDGRYLMVTSIDGFCSIVTLNTELLGTTYQPPTTTVTNEKPEKMDTSDISKQA